MANPLADTILKVGKHKVPRFIYHMTNAENYQKIVESGELKMSKDLLFGEGIFTAELSNLFKRWRKNKAWNMDSLQEKLITQVSKDEDDIVILRIPTANLDVDKLFIRSQNKLFCSGESVEKFIRDTFDKVLKSVSKETAGTFEESCNIVYIKFREIVKKSLKKEGKNHLCNGTSAKYSSLFKQRKEAIEYIYTEDLPIDKIEKIGEVNIAELRKTADYDPVRPMRSIFTKLLEGTPEVKGAELLSC